MAVIIPELGFAKRIPDGGFVEVDSDSSTSMMKVKSYTPKNGYIHTYTQMHACTQLHL